MVVDPNVWVSALINPSGAPARVVMAIRDGDFVAVACQHLLDELAEVLVRPTFRRWIDVADAIAFIEALGGHAEMHPDPPITATVSLRDPDDAYLVALAEATGAAIVTGDADLLGADLRPEAITPAELLKRLP